jgi:hypothetical protein
MRIAILTIGLEDDVRPFIYLGLELQLVAMGAHRVCVVTHDFAKSIIEATGLAFRSIGMDTSTAMVETEGGKVLSTSSVLDRTRAVQNFYHPLMTQWCTNGEAALRTWAPDYVVLGSVPTDMHSILCADVLNLPFCQMHLQPRLPTVAHAPPIGFGRGETWFEFTARHKCVVRPLCWWAERGRVRVNESE